IEPTILEQAGKKFISASEKNPAAWKAATAFLDYRSFLNSQFAPSFPDAQKVDADAPSLYLNFTPLPPPPASTVPVGVDFILGYLLRAHGSTTPDKAAIWNRLSDTSKMGGNFE